MYFCMLQMTTTFPRGIQLKFDSVKRILGVQELSNLPSLVLKARHLSGSAFWGWECLSRHWVRFPSALGLINLSCTYKRAVTKNDFLVQVTPLPKSITWSPSNPPATPCLDSVTRPTSTSMKWVEWWTRDWQSWEPTGSTRQAREMMMQSECLCLPLSVWSTKLPQQCVWALCMCIRT